MKPQIETSDGILGGRQVTHTIKLSEGKQKGNYAIDALGFKKGSVQVFCGAGTGASGTARILQSNMAGGKGFELSTPQTIDFIEGENNGVFDFEFTGRYLSLDLSTISLSGTEGTVTIIYVVKN